MNLRPSEIYFTQSSISSIFGRSTSHRSKEIGETLDDLAEGRTRIGSIPKISVMKENGKWWTADNRRFWIFRYLEKLKKCTEIPVNIIYSIDSRKRSSTNGGTDVSICRGRSPGGIWHRKVDSIKIPDKPKSKDILTLPVVQHHANNQFGGKFSDNIILACNDLPVKPVEPNKGSPYSMIKPDCISSVFKSEAAKFTSFLSMALTKMSYTSTENSPVLTLRQDFSSAFNKTEFEVSCADNGNTQDTSDFLPKCSSPHQSIRYAPYKRVLRTTSKRNTGNLYIEFNRSHFSSKGRFTKTDDPFLYFSIYQQYEHCYSFYPRKSAYSFPKTNDYNYHDTVPDVEDEDEYCYEYESDISDDSQSPDNIKIKAFGESSDESDDETSDESSDDDDSYESDEENSDLSDNDDCSSKKISNNALLKDSRHSKREFQHSCREISDISHDSFYNSVDEFMCYDLTYKKEGYVSSYWDEENSCEYYDEQNTPFKYLNMEDSAITNIDSSDDHYTADLDSAYLAGSYNSDVDNMIYDYID